MPGRSRTLILRIALGLHICASAVSASAEARPVGPLGLTDDERLDLQVDPNATYGAVVSELVRVVPSPALPRGLGIDRANNNLSIALHEGRLFLAFRTAPIHFASAQARIVVVSSPDLGRSWAFEASFATGRDLREPFLLAVGGRLHLYFAEMGDRFYTFDPKGLWRARRGGRVGSWSTAESWGAPEEVAWDFKVRGGYAWMTSYRGKHYAVRSRPIAIHFRWSIDGLDWQEVGTGPVYLGGATEASFEFDPRGGLWAITRNEDGDATGFGSQVASAEPADPGRWKFPPLSSPSRYDSPRLFRHGPDVYLLARRDLGPPVGARFASIPGEARKLMLWASYSLQPKRTALYRLDQSAREFVHVLDLPSAGDTAFPAIARLSAHEFLVANYSSAFRHKDRTWLWGQLNSTGIYFVRLRFEAGSPHRVAHDSPSSPADESWPMADTLSRRLVGLGAVSFGAFVAVRRWRWRRPTDATGAVAAPPIRESA